jgi:hypothetical protein
VATLLGSRKYAINPTTTVYQHQYIYWLFEGDLLRAILQ